MSELHFCSYYDASSFNQKMERNITTEMIFLSDSCGFHERDN